MKNVLLLATLDTKQQEADLLKRYIEKAGCGCLVLDCSLVESHSPYDELRRDMLTMCGIDEASLSAMPKSRSHPLIQEAACRITEKLYNSGCISGGIGIGGVQGTTIAAAALQKLPIGVPKMLFSAVANGQMTFGPLVGASDMMVMHSVVDVSGSNHIIKSLLKNAGVSIASACLAAEPAKRNGLKSIGITMGGVTTRCVEQIKGKLESMGCEVLVFHCNGVGARAMEDLVRSGEIDAVMDITPHDVMDKLMGGLMPASDNRYSSVVERGIPLLIAPGCADIILYNGLSNVPAEMVGRKIVEHNELHSHVKANYQEMFSLGEYFKDRLGGSGSRVAVAIPEGGFSQKNYRGGPLYEPESDAGLTDSLMQNTPDNFTLHRIAAHINDSEFAQACVDLIMEMTASDTN